MIALCLQCCPLDEKEALELTELIVDIEPELRKDGEFFLVYRRDCNPKIAKDFMAIAAKKFCRVTAREGRNFDIGWPSGSNMLAGSAFIEMTILRREDICRHNAFLLFEPDCFPLSTDWLDQLSLEWERVEAEGLEAFGHHHQQWDITTKHMNGNAVFRCDWFDRHSSWIIGAGTMGWDYFFKDQILSVSRDSNLIHQLYNTHGFTTEQFQLIQKNGVRPVFLHGIKTPDGRAIARDLLVT